MNSVAMSGEVPQTMKPLGLGDSLLYFGVPTVVVTTIYWVVLWVTTTLGVLGYYAHLLALLLGISTLSIGTMLELRREGYAISWQVIKTRLRWRRMTPTAWLWMVIVFLAAAAVTFPFLEPLNARLLEAGVFAVPDFVPISLNPLSTLDSLEAYRLDIGGKAIGNWWPAITLFVVNLISVTSEELWWRGIVLPRQEKGLGAWAWIIHGVLWAPFHLFKYWAFIPLFGVTLGLAYLGQRTKNTTPVFILHFLINVATGVAGAFLIAMGVGIS